MLVALVMLLLLTIIGVASMRGTSLQENMANNLKEHDLAFQGAEAALRAGERRAARERRRPALSDMKTCEDDGLDGLIVGYVDNLGLAERPKYEICLLDKRKTSLDTQNTGEGPDIMMVRIDAEGYGLAVDSSNKPVITVSLRSTFRIKLDN